MHSTIPMAEQSVPRGRVLLVDDDEQVRRMFDAALRRAGFAVIEAATAEDAVARVDAEPVDVVLLDVGLPDRSGVDVVGDLRGRPGHRTLPIVLVTGREDIDDRVQGLDAGADDYVIKPIRPDELVARVCAQLRSRDAWSEVVDRMLADRAETLGALGGIESDRLDGAAERICHVLASAREVDHASLVIFTDHGAQVFSASIGTGAAIRPVSLDKTEASWLRDHAAHGVAITSREAPNALGSLLPPEAVGVGVPIPGPDGPRGVLVLGTKSDLAEHRSVDRVLATAADAVPTVSRILTPLLARETDDVARERIRRVVEQRAFFPVYQPVVNVATRAVVGFEGLTRFEERTSPAIVFNDAARTGLDKALEEPTMRLLLASAADLPEGCWLSLNISAAFLTRDAPLHDLLERSERPVVLELTEREPVDDYQGVRAMLASLSDNVRLAIDDVGAGYASLRHVFTLNPHFVKLDRAWMTGLDENPVQRELLAGIARFAGRTGISIIAEGVEHEEQAVLVEQLGIPLAQGFLYGRPRPVEEWSAPATD